MDHDLAQIWEAGWHFPRYLWNALPPYERSFALLELAGTRTVEFYRMRVRAIGFTDGQAVLDAGCGMGQWSLALAEVNRRVEGIDMSKERVRVADALRRQAEQENCSFRVGSMESLPFLDASFDFVFCYGAFMFTNMPKSLGEFARVLRPHGRLYLNANTYGWYAHLILDRGLRKRNWTMVRRAFTMVGRMLLGAEAEMLVRKKWLRRLLTDKGFEVVALDAEGHIRLDTPGTAKPLPEYPKTFYGMPAIIEVVASRRQR